MYIAYISLSIPSVSLQKNHIVSILTDPTVELEYKLALVVLIVLVVIVLGSQ